MKKKYSTLIVFFGLFLLGISISFAQNNQLIWNKIDKDNIIQDKIFRKSEPEKAVYFNLNTEKLKQKLENAPITYSKNFTSEVLVDLPNNEGELITYAISEAPVFSEELQKQLPEIRSYKGVSIADPSKVVRFSISPKGFHAFMLKTDKGSQYIDPYTRDNKTYIVYSKRDLPEIDLEFVCEFENNQSRSAKSTSSQSSNLNDGNLRTFRLALACTHEYAEYHITNPAGTDEEKKDEVLAAMNTTMTRVNGVYENDLSIRMEIIANNKDIIFIDEASDPFTGNDSAGTLIGESQTVIDATIGDANYDIGHTFSTGAGGLASLGVPCQTGTKARGVTGLSNPIGDTYDIDYVAHEIGHQFGANHTFNNSCSSNRNNATAVEPGSGSTIMAYAGICSPNVQNNSDDYFHIISIREMWEYVTTGNGTCANQSNTGNSSPTLTPIADYYIPRSTPFVLKGNGSDPDGSGSLTYSWEQTDIQIANMPPESTSTGGPLFRSLTPSTSPDRYMPAVETVITGETESTWEVVPSVARDMNFTLTVRDNDVRGGRYVTDDIVIHTENVDPFVVTEPTIAVVWGVGTTKTVSWDVGSTTNGTINCQNVNIKLSTDGGFTYPIDLATNTPNDGTEDITIPNNMSSSCRIMVESVGNIFYAITPVDFTIAAEDGDPDYCASTYTNIGSEYISNVTFKSINNDSGDAPVDGYEDFTNISTDVEYNESIQLDVEINTAGDFTDNCKVYIDWNKDFIFDPVAEVYDLGSITNVTAGVLSSTISIPDDANIGSTRMRVSIEFNSNNKVPGPCNANHASEWGETEDYTLNVFSSLSVGDEVFDNFRMYPNPTNNLVNITLKADSTEDIHFRLFDLVGREVFSKTFENNSLVFNRTLELDDFSQGIYILKIDQGKKSTTKELIIK